MPLERERELLLPAHFWEDEEIIKSKGYLDARVRIGQEIHRVSFYTITRLLQDLEDEENPAILRVLIVSDVAIGDIRRAVATAPDWLFNSSQSGV